MNAFYRILIFVISLLLNIDCFSQIGNEHGQYDNLIDDAYRIISDLRHQRKSIILSRFVESEMQTKKELKEMLSNRNMKWAKGIIMKYGAPEKREISITTMLKTTKDKSVHNASVNLTLYFKGKNAPFDLLNDNISINYLILEDGSFVMNGLLFFKRDDYLLVKKLFDQIPENY